MVGLEAGLLPNPLLTLVVNLDRDTDRLAATIKQLSHIPTIAAERISAVLGSALADELCFRLTKRKDPARGTLGCFLSHAGIWRRVVDEDIAWVLVVEDDIEVDRERVRELSSLRIPADADIVFCNSRMDPRPDRAQEDGLCAYPVRSILPIKIAARRAVGTDGYLLSKAGAGKLVAAVERDGYAAHVDWRLLRYCLDQDVVAPLIRNTWLESGSRFRDNGVASGILTGYCLSPAPIRRRRNAGSTRKGLDAGAREADEQPPS